MGQALQATSGLYERGGIVEAACWAHTIRTQSTVPGRHRRCSGCRSSQWNDMLDLQGIVMDWTMMRSMTSRMMF